MVSDLQPAKTRVVSKERFKRMISKDHETRLKNKTAGLHILWKTFKAGDYEDPSTVTLSQEDLAQAEAAPLQAELRRSLQDQDNPE